MLTTTNAVYYVTGSTGVLGVVTKMIREGSLIPVTDDNGTEGYLNPSAVITVREEEDL